MDDLRNTYMMDVLDTHQGLPRLINREKIFEEVIEMYQNNFSEILSEFPFRIKFLNEMAVDTGGVCRDMLSDFWEKAYLRLFDGERLLVPIMDPSVNLSMFSVLGFIIAQGFMVTGFLPIRISFPVLASVLCGIEVTIPETIMVESFIDYLSNHECSVLKAAISHSGPFSDAMKNSLISILSRLGCTEVPSSNTIRKIIVKTAKYQLVSKSLGTLLLMRASFPTSYNSFFQQFSIEQLFELYKSLGACSSTVLQCLREPEFLNKAEERTYRYLLTFIGNSKPEQLRLFLRFVSGSSVVLSSPIKVTFNNLSGLARRPISHTCDCTLELPLSYSSYPEFEHEFFEVLASDTSWIMDVL